jgi:hypothetical protein
MAYQPCHCSITLLCSVCISVFCTPLALSVLLPFILSAPYPFDATFLYRASLHLRSASLLTLESFPTTTTLISSLFPILIVPVLLVHAVFAFLCMLTHPQSPAHLECFCLIIATLQLLWWFPPRV